MERDEIGEWYARRDREARELAEQLRQAREAGADAKTIRDLETRLERARYVGD